MAGENVKLLPLKGSSGVKRDGTVTEGTYWDEGLWTRFYRGLPRSIPGYRSLSENYHGPSRGMLLDSRNGLLNIYSGFNNGIEVGQFTRAGAGSAPQDRTPLTFQSSDTNVWQLDSMFTTNGSGFTAILAHAGQNLVNIDSTVRRPLYYGDITTVTPLIDTGMSISGGVCYLNPYVVVYGDNGILNVSTPADPTNFPITSNFNICPDKIVKVLPIRGGAYAPAGLIWSLSYLLRMSFVGGAVVWQFDTLSDSSSVLSSSAMIEHDGIYYWPGADRWLTYNGVVRELSNNMSLDFFYNNLNYAQQQKVFVTKIPRWGEIWWCAPLFGATECNWAIIYNYRENTWYDTPLPQDGRSAAIIPTTTFPYPIMASGIGLDSLIAVGQKSFPVWQHEYGTDHQRGGKSLAIRSSITSPTLSFVGGGLTLGGVNVPADNVWTQLVRFEPDFVDSPNLDMDILTRDFPQDVETVINVPINTDIEDIDKQGRYMRYRITCNASGQRMILGQSLLHFRPGDRTP